MANNLFQVKRTSVSGRTPNTTNSANTQYIAAGELALNMTDGIMYSSNGSVLLPIGANLVNQNVSNTLTVKAISANGGLGSPGEILASNGSATYWTTVGGTGTVTSVGSANGIAGGPITGTGTLYVVAGNSTVFVNASGVHVNTSALPTSGGVDVDAQYTWTNTQTFQNTITFNSTIIGTVNNALYLNGKQESALNVNSALTANSSTYLGSKQEADLNVNSALTSNSTSFVGSVSAANVVSNAQLQANLANYDPAGSAATAYSNAIAYSGNAAQAYTNAIAQANIYANNAYNNAVAYVGSLSLVNTAQLSGNLSLYQTTAGLSANVATLTANNTSFVGTVSAANVVSNAQLSANLANYAALSGATFTGNVTANNANTTYDLNVGRNLTVGGNLTITGNVTVIGANNLSIVDNMIYLNSNSTVSNPDLGFAGNYNDGTYHHAGFFRDHATGTWKVFDNYDPEPDANVNIDQANSSFHVANFQANVIYVGNNTVYATVNTTNYTGTANNANNLGGVAAAGYVQNTDSRTLSGNLYFTGANVYYSSGLFVGANVVANTTTISIGNSTVNTVITAGVTTHSYVQRDSFSTTTAGTLEQIVDSWATASYRSVKYVLSVKNNNANGYQLSEVLILSDDTNPQITEYGIVQSNGSLGTYSANSNSTHVRLTFTPTSTSTTIKADRLLISA